MNSSQVDHEKTAKSDQNHELSKRHQCHLLKRNVENKVMTSQVVDKEIVTGDSIAIFANKNDQKNPPDVPHTPPRRSNFEKLWLVFEEKMKGNEVLEFAKSSHSPSLTRLMQLNEKKLSESLKNKRDSSNKKKLKKLEKETKLAKETKERLKVRDIQVMFDKMSQNSAIEGKSQNKNSSRPKIDVNNDGIVDESDNSNDQNVHSQGGSKGGRGASTTLPPGDYKKNYFGRPKLSQSGNKED